MTSEERRRRADRIFDAALDLDAAARGAFVERECGGDAELRDLVLRLIDSADSGESVVSEGGALAGPLFDRVAREIDEDDPLREGARVGRWRVLSEIGRGGMGVVHVAERADGTFEQKVALKRIKRGVDSDEVLRRFERERRILAKISHPDIARLLDGGVDDEGRPFLVMELVEGKPIDRWCDERRLSLRDRLRLFARVAKAVHDAHRNLVVHRDLKPSNILVTEDGHPKLLDFGIAKLLDDETGEAEATRTGVRPMTPAWASPEQIRGAAVTTSSDVYQLGLLLFRLLTGRTPFRAGAGRGPDAVARAIVEDEPTRPSAAVGDPTLDPEAGLDGGADAGAVAALRSSTPARLKRDLEGDLDVILMSALRKEPERRYPSVAALVDDVERHLKGRPVTARPDTLFYRAGKFVRRNKAAVFAASFALVTLVAYAVTMALQARSIAVERDRANAEAETARQVSAFLTDIFKVSDPSRARGDTITAHEVLDRGVATIDEKMPEPTLARGRLKRTMGQVYENLGLYADALPLYREGYETTRAVLGPDAEETWNAQADLGGIYWRLARYDEAEPLFRDVYEKRRAAHGLADDATIRAANDLANFLHTVGRYPEAESLYRETLEAARKLHGDEHRFTLGLANNLANVLDRLDRKDEAAELVKFSLDGMRRAFGRDHPDSLGIAKNYADRLEDLGRLEEALSVYREVVEGDTRVLGPEHPMTLLARRGLAALEFKMGKHESAIRSLREVLDGCTRALGPAHPDTGGAHYWLGVCLRDGGAEGTVAEAEAHLRKAAEIFERNYGPLSDPVVSAWTEVAVLHLKRGESRETVEALHELVRRGWGDASFLDDPDLEPLRGRPDFEELRRTVEARLKASP